MKHASVTFARLYLDIIAQCVSFLDTLKCLTSHRQALREKRANMLSTISFETSFQIAHKGVMATMSSVTVEVFFV